MKRRDFPARWSITFLVVALLLVACERPLQEDVTLEAETPSPAEGTPSDPGLATPTDAAPSLEPTPTGAAPVEPTEAGNGEEQPTAEPDDTAEPTPEGENGEQPAEDVIHTVVAGDTLGRIAERYGVSVEAIAGANDIANINSLEVGQQLLIPLSGEVPDGGEATGEEQVHTVAAGDTLFSIGRRYGFTVEELATYNDLANPNSLEVGQEIRIPPQGYSVDE